MSYWVSLPNRRRNEVWWMAAKGKRASDPETAWLIVGIIRVTTWGRWSALARYAVLVGFLAVGLASWIAFTPAAGMICFVFGGAHLALAINFPRALRLNDPIAVPPPPT